MVPSVPDSAVRQSQPYTIIILCVFLYRTIWNALHHTPGLAPVKEKIWRGCRVLPWPSDLWVTDRAYWQNLTAREAPTEMKASWRYGERIACRYDLNDV